MEPFNRPKPQTPAHMIARSRQITQIDRSLTSALRGSDIAEALAETELLARDWLIEMNRPLTAEEKDAEDRYRLEVAKYNEAAAAYNERLAAERQARLNARETAKIRKSLCPTCFCAHPGEC